MLTRAKEIIIAIDAGIAKLPSDMEPEVVMPIETWAALKTALIEVEQATAKRCAEICRERIKQMLKHTNHDGDVTGADFWSAEIEELEHCAAAIEAEYGGKR